MPDDDLTFGELRFRIGGGQRPLRRTIAKLGIEPRRVGAITFYTQEQVRRIEAEHQVNSKDTHKSPVGRH